MVYNRKIKEVLGIIKKERVVLGISGLIEKMKSAFKLVEFQRLYTESDLQLICGQIEEGKYKFSPMRRFLIPKPNKPGELRPITKPAKRDCLIFEGLHRLLTEAYEPYFSDYSHGFRPGRGPNTFHAEVAKWPPVDRLFQMDFVRCFDEIVQKVLINDMREQGLSR